MRATSLGPEELKADWLLYVVITHISASHLDVVPGEATAGRLLGLTLVDGDKLLSVLLINDEERDSTHV